MLELILKGSSKDELYCEITDVLDDYLLKGYKKRSWLRSYLCKYDNKTLCIRVSGATRGNIKLEKNVIKEINLYDDTAFSKGLGCYDKKKKNELIEKLNKFIGCSFK